MFTSAKIKKDVIRTVYIYIGVTLFVALFGGIYEIFSHNVFSPSMYLAWLYPLIGLATYLLLRFLPIKTVPGMIPACIFNFGVAMITVRSIFDGVLEIYGKTNNNILFIYTALAIVFLSTGSVLYLFIIIYFNLIRSHSRAQND